LQCESFLGRLLHYDVGSDSSSSTCGRRACEATGALPLIHYDSAYDLDVVSDQKGSEAPGGSASSRAGRRRLALRYRRDRYPPGSWEWAAASVYFDAHNQLGLALLSFAIDYPLRDNPTAESFIVVIDRLHAAAAVLGQALVSVQALGGPLSSSLHDLEKNAATCYMQLHSMLDTAARFRPLIVAELARWGETNSRGAGGRLPLLHDAATFEAALLGPEALVTVAARAAAFIEAYLEHYPDSKDAPTYLGRLAAIRGSSSSSK
jgi:hypothetical protein